MPRLPTFERQRVEGDRRLEYAGARADAGADLIEIREATTRTMSRIGERVDADPDTGGANRSSPALTEGDVLASLAEIRTLIGIGRSRAMAATEAVADRFRAEELRRQTEARRLVERAALEAQWAREQAALAAGAGARIEAMYGGYRLNPVFAGN